MSIKLPTIMIKKNLVIDTKSIEKILRYFIVEHSTRKYNFVYWNLVDPKHMSLCFVNLTGKKLNRLNNSDLGFRIVKVKNRKDWNVIKYLFDTYITSEDDKRAVSVVRLDYLFSYLKGIKFDLNKIHFDINSFGTKYFVTTDNKGTEKHKPVSTVDNDVQSLYLLERLYTKYSPMIDCGEGFTGVSISDIRDEFMTCDSFKYSLDDDDIRVPVTDGLDIIAKRFVKNAAKVDEEYTVSCIHSEVGLSNIVNRFENDRMIVISLRVYLKYFLKSIRPGRRRKKRNG